MSRPQHLEVGYVARAHGLRGEIAVRTHDPDSDIIERVQRLQLRRGDTVHDVHIRARRPADDEWLLTLEKVRDRTGAEALRGTTVFVYREDIDEADEPAGEFFQGDLIGLRAVDEKGTELGQVEELWNTGPVPNLVIRGAGGAELLVPFADDFVIAVEPEQGRIVLRPPEYGE